MHCKLTLLKNMNFQTISRDLWLLTNFRNGWEMVRYLRQPQPIGKATLLDGKSIVHPNEKCGLVEAILELWYKNEYFPKGFYQAQAGDNIVDLGANIGLFSMQVARMNPDCKIAAFEPMPENYSCLTQNINAFNFQNIQTYQLAVSDRQEKLYMMESPGRSLDCQFVKHHQGMGLLEAELSVDCIAIESIFDLIGSQKISLLKMDIEGGEEAIFKSISSKVLTRINSLVIEYHSQDILRLVTDKLLTTHDLKTFDSYPANCGLLFAVSR
jgi:FkbM family methyltransferase